MKKLCVFMLCLILFSCNNKHGEEENDGRMFEIVEEHIDSYCIVYDKDTKVMYCISTGYYNSGNMQLLVDENGKPKLYKKK